MDMNPSEGGVHLTLTSFVDATPAQVHRAALWVDQTAEDLKADAREPWTASADGPVAPPQKRPGEDEWFVNLCCNQATLGVVSRLMRDDPSVWIFSDTLALDDRGQTVRAVVACDSQEQGGTHLVSPSSTRQEEDSSNR